LAIRFSCVCVCASAAGLSRLAATWSCFIEWTEPIVSLCILLCFGFTAKGFWEVLVRGVSGLRQLKICVSFKVSLSRF
jgi:hypothetical protein